MTDREKFISLVDNDCIRSADVIILLEGDGFNRCQQAAALYHAGYAKTIVFSGVVDKVSDGSFPFSKIKPFLLKKGIPKENIIHENTSTNTRGQALAIIKMAKSFGWKRLILVASNYHQYRAYLTFLRCVLDSTSDMILYNAPAKNLLWFAETGWGQRFDLLDQEFSKIVKYSALSHLSTFKEAIVYQKWKEQQV